MPSDGTGQPYRRRRGKRGASRAGTRRSDRPLTARAKRFALEYAKDGNAAQAYVRAGYRPKTKNVALVQGNALLQNEKVAALIADEINAQLTKVSLETTDVLKEIARLAFSDASHYVPGTAERPIVLAPGAPEHAMRAVSSVEWRFLEPADKAEPRRLVGVKFRLWSKSHALRLASEHLGLLRQLDPGATAGALSLAMLQELSRMIQGAEEQKRLVSGEIVLAAAAGNGSAGAGNGKP